MYTFLLDENLSPSLEKTFWSYGIDTVHVRNRNMLGAPDHEVWRYAQHHARSIVTINALDFKKLAANTPEHFGVLAIPSSSGRSAQHDNIMTALKWVGGINAYSAYPLANRYIEVCTSGELEVIDFKFKEE